MKGFLSLRATTLVFTQVSGTAAAFAISLMAASIMSPASRGELALWLQICYLATTIILMGIERPYVSLRSGGFYQSASELDQLVGRRRYIAALFLVVALTAVIFSERELAITALIAGGFVVVDIYTRIIRSAFISSGARGPLVVSALVVPSLTLVMCFGALVARNGSAIVWFGSYFLAGLLVLPYVFRARRLSPEPKKGEGWFAEVRRRGVQLLPASLSNTAMLRADRLILPAMAGTGELGIYVVVATIMEAASWPISQWVDTSIRQWSIRFRDGGTRPIGKHTLIRAMAFVVLVTLAAGVFAWAAVGLLLPPSYEFAATLIFPCGVATVVYGATRLQQGILIAEGRSQYLQLSVTMV